jgi:hypothetical protein
VFERFKHRDWEPEIVPELHGTNGRLQIVMHNLPCLHDTQSGERKFVFSEFGSELLERLCAEELADLDHVRRVVSTGHKTVYVRLRDQPAIIVRVAGQIPQDRERFCADLADCLVNAFRAERILH